MHKATEPVSILFVYCKTHKEKIKQNNHKKQQEEEEEGTVETHKLFFFLSTEFTEVEIVDSPLQISPNSTQTH